MNRLIKNKTLVILLFLFVVSFVSNIFFYVSLTSKGVSFGDSWSRLNIARRVVDNLTPGLAQLGGVWLPFPQVLIVPFAAVDFLYYSGLASVIISALAFILAGLFIYKLLTGIAGSWVAGAIGLLIYVSNPNLLHLQSTAMSEPLFLCAVFGALYFIWKWIRGREVLDLIAGAFWIATATLTRYEGFFLLAGSIFIVALLTYIRTRKLAKVESILILFTTIAAFGVVLWCVYNAAIFGDALAWAKIYAGKRAIISSEELIISESVQAAKASQSTLTYFFRNLGHFGEAAVQMNGIFSALAGVVALFIVFITSLFCRIKKLNLEEVAILFLSSMTGLFIVFSGIRHEAIIQNPPLNLQFLFHKDLFSFSEYNIRYGLMALPFFIVFPAIVLSKIKILGHVFIGVLLVQPLFTLSGKVNAYYNIPQGMLRQRDDVGLALVDWFKSNYDGGLVLISANANDPLMYKFRIPYKNYIFEGTDKYWKESLVEPSKHAKYLVFKNAEMTSTGGFSDLVSYYLKDNSKLLEDYDEVYKDSGYLVYKLKI